MISLVAINFSVAFIMVIVTFWAISEDLPIFVILLDAGAVVLNVLVGLNNMGVFNT